MASEQDGSLDARVVMLEVLEDPAGEAGRLPQLLGMLDDHDPQTRILAACAISIVANENPDMVEPIARRLVDRLAHEAENPETIHVLAYLRHRFPERVGETLQEIARETREEGQLQRQNEISRRFAQTDLYGHPSLDRGMGRIEFAGGDNQDDPRSVFKEEGEEIGGAPAETRDDHEDNPNEVELRRAETAEELPEEGTEEQEVNAARERQEQLDKLDRAEAEIGIEQIIDESRFDVLSVVAPPVRGRYTDIYRTRARKGTTEEGIALHTFRLPDEDPESFVNDICEVLRDWQAVSDHDFIVTLYDWSREPGLWLATEYTADTLYDRYDLELAEAIWNGLQAAETISHCHQYGVVHSGIDPYNVAYTGATIEGQRQPLLSNVSLLDVLRMYEEPSEYLDPRYAAPEYFQRRYGQVDHATDIYQLGAVLYKLTTGRAPFEGNYSEVRQGVLESTPPAPSEINPEIPDWIDGVVQKAMAKQKLTRYETASQLAQEIRAELGETKP